MKINLITIGKLSPDIELLCKRYRSMISWQLEYIELPHSNKDNPQEIINDESVKIQKKLRADAITILLDRQGKQYSSEEFASLLEQQRSVNNKFDIVIGGAYGVSKLVGNLSAYKISLSKMTFPHQLAKLLIMEQIYRAQTILQNHPYHK